MNVQDFYGFTPLLKATLKGNVDIIELLLDNGASIDYTDNDGNTALYHASKNQKLSSTYILIERSSNLYHQNNDGETVLIAAIAYSHTSVIGCILQNNVDILHIPDYTNKTVLHHACSSYFTDAYPVLQLLFDYSVDKYINTQDEEGYTPLFYACNRGNLDIVQLLIEKGADIHIQSKDGKIAIVEAFVNGHDHIIEYLLPLYSSDEIINIHTDTFSDVCTNGFLHMLRLLFSIGAKLHFPYSIEALNKAISYNYESIVYFLLYQLDIDVNYIDDKGNTPLIYACIRPRTNIDIIELLLDHGANIHIMNHQNQTAISIAKGYKNTNIINLFDSYNYNNI